MADSLEEIANEHTSKPTANSDNLETKVNDSENKGFIGRFFDRIFSYGKMALDYAIAAAATAFSYAMIGPMAFVAVGTAIAGDIIINCRKGFSTPSRMIRDSALWSGLWAIPWFHSFRWMNQFIGTSTLAGKVTRAVVQLGVLPHVFGPLGHYTGYVLRNKSSKGFGKYMKDFYWKTYRDGTLWFGLPNMLAAYNLPAPMHYPIDLASKLVGRVALFGRILDKYDYYKKEKVPLKQNYGFFLNPSYGSKPRAIF